MSKLTNLAYSNFPSGDVLLPSVGTTPHSKRIREVKQTWVDTNVCRALGVSLTEIAAMEYGRSHVDYNKLVSRLNSYASKPKMRFDPRHYKVALRNAKKAFELPKPVRKLRLKHVGFKPGSAAGIGYTGQKGDNEEKARGRAYFHVHNKVLVKTPCAMYARGHFGYVDDPKTRLVWGFPFHQTLIEGMYAEPLIAAYNKLTNGVMTIGKGSLTIAARMNTCLLSGSVNCVDFSQFDSSISETLIRDAFDILFSQFEDVGRTHRRLIEEYFINTPIATPNGEIYRKSHGVPSGSYFTQLVDSVVNCIAVHYICHRQDEYPQELQVLGDDSIFSTNKKLDPSWSVKIAAELGLIVNAEKSDFDTRMPRYLGHYYSKGRLARPKEETIARLLFLEVPRQSTPLESINRCLGHYVDSGGDVNTLQTALRIAQQTAKSDPQFWRTYFRDKMVNPTGWMLGLGSMSRPFKLTDESVLLHH